MAHVLTTISPRIDTCSVALFRVIFASGTSCFSLRLFLMYRSLFCWNLSSASVAGDVRMFRPLVSIFCRFADLMYLSFIAVSELQESFWAFDVNSFLMTYLLLLSCLPASLLLLALWCPSVIQLLLHVSCSRLPAAGEVYQHSGSLYLFCCRHLPVWRTLLRLP